MIIQETYAQPHVEWHSISSVTRMASAVYMLSFII